ncbi:hypothetical protein BG004_005874 [Podila humilis]|nr:hypothetical protein BG004_005874 [Podila humilis]
MARTRTATGKDTMDVSSVAAITRSMAGVKVAHSLAPADQKLATTSIKPLGRRPKSTSILADLTNTPAPLLTNTNTNASTPGRAQTRYPKPLVTLPVPVVASEPNYSSQPKPAFSSASKSASNQQSQQGPLHRRRTDCQDPPSLTKAASMSSLSISHPHSKGLPGHATAVIPTPGTIRKIPTSTLASISTSSLANLRTTNNATSVHHRQPSAIAQTRREVAEMKKVAVKVPVPSLDSVATVERKAPPAPRVSAFGRQRAPRDLSATAAKQVSSLRKPMASSRSVAEIPQHTNINNNNINAVSQAVRLGRKRATKGHRGPLIPAVPLYDEVQESGPSASQDTEMSSMSPRPSFEVPVSGDIVDEYDRDPKMMAEYQADILQYMRQKEIELMPNAQYMNHQPEITWEFRAQLIHWLVTVHDRFDLLQETLHLCVNFLDRFLSATVIPVTQLQLAGIVALSLASKFEETQTPSLAYLSEMAANAYSVAQIKAAEIGMLKVLNYDLGAPGPMTFLRRISRADAFDVDLRTLTKYLVDVTLCDQRFLAMPASQIAAVGYCASRRLLCRGGWSTEHEEASGYGQKELTEGVNLVLALLEIPEVTHPSILAKYQEERCMRASEYVQALGVVHLRSLHY